MKNKLLEWLWSLLPDQCEMANYGCCRKGVRGNENLYHDSATDVNFVLCDYCGTQYYKAQS